MDVIVVGGGVVGTMHARAAVARGDTVVHIEADAEPRQASVRNFGLVWVSGRAAGPELELALRARELWASIGREVPAVGFRADGSLTVAQHAAELAVFEAACRRPDAAERGLRLLEPAEARRVNPALRGELVAALWCERDAIVEPGRCLSAVRRALAGSGRYRFLARRTALDVTTGAVRDHTGARHRADLVIVCPGAASGMLAGCLGEAPLRRCRLQMLQTQPLGERLTTALADGDSLRYYPAYRVPAADGLPVPPPVAARYRAQLLVAQRDSGELTVGDTHEYDEPFDFALDDAAGAYLLGRAESILGRPLPPVHRRWAGVYSQATDERACFRARPLPGVVVVTGLGGRGMTLAPAVAEETLAGVAG